MANKNTDQKPRKEPRKFTFTLTMPGVFSLMSGLALVVTFFFVMGLLIGRGYRPEAEVPQLARIMPEPATQNALGGADAQEPAQALKPEDLEFDAQLEKKPDEVQAEAEQAARVKAEAPVKKTEPATEPARPAAQSVAKTEKTEKVEIPAAAPGDKQFDYVYQAASFRKKEMADALAGKIRDKGLDGYVDTTQVGENTWHRVFVRFRGTPDQTSAMKTALSELGINKPLMRQKKAVIQ